MRAHRLARELVVDTIRDDKLDLVMRRETADIVPVVRGRLSASWALDIDDLDHTGRHTSDRSMSPSLNHHREASAEEALHQRVDILLQERLSPGHFDKAAPDRLNLGDHVVDRALLPVVKRVRRVAPDTAEVAASESYEYARLSRTGRFTLDGVEDLVDRQHDIFIIL
mgnify:CR=1 FL=1